MWIDAYASGAGKQGREGKTLTFVDRVMRRLGRNRARAVIRR